MYRCRTQVITANSIRTTIIAIPSGEVKLPDEKGQGMSDAAQRGHQAAYQAAQPGMSAAREASVIGKGFGETHADPGADRSCKTYEKGGPGVVSCKSRGKNGRQSGNRAIHQAGEARLDDLQEEKPSAGPPLPGGERRTEFGFFQFFRAISCVRSS